MKMREYIYTLFENSRELSMQDIAIQIVMALIIGIVIYFSYFLSHVGTVYSRKFNTSLLTLTLLTATVMTVIGNNIALSLGMVGALSIVRFRTAIKDSRDTMYIFWAIIVGICCGVGDFVVSAMGSAVVFLVLLALGRVKNDNRLLIIIRSSRGADQSMEATIFEMYGGKALLRVKNTTPDSVELIYEIPRQVYLRLSKGKKSLTEQIYELGNVDYVNIVAQNDEISG